MSGRLVLVGTPIGNLEDMSPRAIATLADADLIACEDTRHTGQLLRRLGITRDRTPRGTEAGRVLAVTGDGGPEPAQDRLPLIAVHDHNEERQIERILSRLRNGDTVALVSDAGMPGISDPGERLVAAVIEAGQQVEVVPGPTAGVAALVMSGMTAGRFCFEGFLPRKGSARTRRLADLKGERRTIVLFEAPHRLHRTIGDLVETLGPERRISLSREITKRFEETWRGTLAEAVAWSGAADPRGEFVVVVDGADEPEPADDSVVSAQLEQLLGGGSSVKDAAATVAQDLGLRKRHVYNLALEVSRQHRDGEPEPE